MIEKIVPPKGPKSRSLHFTRAEVNEDSRTVAMSISSDSDTVLRYVPGIGKDGYGGYAWEVLDHSSIKCIDLSRFAGDNGGPLLYNHDRSVLIGRFVPTGVKDGKLQGNGRFGRSPLAAEKYQDVLDEILSDTSIYYDYDPKDVEVTGFREGYPIATVRKWSLTEASMVPVPADITTGVGRAEEPEDAPEPVAEPARAEEPKQIAGSEEPSDGATETDGQVVDPSVTNDVADEDPEDESLRDTGGHDPDCEDPDCTDENPCDNCKARAAQDPGDRAVGQRSEPTPVIEAGNSRKAVAMTPEEIAAQAANAPKVASVEVQEAIQIRAIADQLGHGRKADEFLGQLPLAEARQAILAHLAANQSAVAPKSLVDLGASKKETEEFNYGRACLNAVTLAEGGREGKNFEQEISDTIGKSMPSNYQRHGGIFLPYAIGRGQRDTPITSIAAGAGAEAVFTQPGEVINVLRNALVTAKLGATVFTGLDAPLGLPRQDTDIVASWVTESSGTASETEFTTSLVTLTPKTLMATTATTRQLLELAVKQFATQARIMNSIAFASQKAIDAAAMFGSGVTPIPQGIYGAAGVTAVPFGAAAGVVPTAPYAYTDIIKMIAAVAAANVPFESVGFVTTPQMAGILMGTLKFSVNGALALWDGGISEGIMAGAPAYSTNQVPSNLGTGTNCHGLLFGAWVNLLIGIFGNGFEVIVDPYSMKKSGIIEITSFNMADVKLAHAAAFSSGTNACVSGTAQTTA